MKASTLLKKVGVSLTGRNNSRGRDEASNDSWSDSMSASEEEGSFASSSADDYSDEQDNSEGDDTMSYDDTEDGCSELAGDSIFTEISEATEDVDCQKKKPWFKVPLDRIRTTISQSRADSSSRPDEAAVKAAEALVKDLETMGYNLDCQSFISKGETSEHSSEERYKNGQLIHPSEFDPVLGNRSADTSEVGSEDPSHSKSIVEEKSIDIPVNPVVTDSLPDKVHTINNVKAPKKKVKELRERTVIEVAMIMSSSDSERDEDDNESESFNVASRDREDIQNHQVSSISRNCRSLTISRTKARNDCKKETVMDNLKIVKADAENYCREKVVSNISQNVSKDLVEKFPTDTTETVDTTTHHVVESTEHCKNIRTDLSQEDSKVFLVHKTPTDVSETQSTTTTNAIESIVHSHKNEFRNDTNSEMTGPFRKHLEDQTPKKEEKDILIEGMSFFEGVGSASASKPDENARQSEAVDMSTLSASTDLKSGLSTYSSRTSRYKLLQKAVINKRPKKLCSETKSLPPRLKALSTQSAEEPKPISDSDCTIDSKSKALDVLKEKLIQAVASRNSVGQQETLEKEIENWKKAKEIANSTPVIKNETKTDNAFNTPKDGTECAKPESEGQIDGNNKTGFIDIVEDSTEFRQAIARPPSRGHSSASVDPSLSETPKAKGAIPKIFRWRPTGFSPQKRKGGPISTSWSPRKVQEGTMCSKVSPIIHFPAAEFSNVQTLIDTLKTPQSVNEKAMPSPIVISEKLNFPAVKPDVPNGDLVIAADKILEPVEVSLRLTEPPLLETSEALLLLNPSQEQPTDQNEVMVVSEIATDESHIKPPVMMNNETLPFAENRLKEDNVANTSKRTVRFTIFKKKNDDGTLTSPTSTTTSNSKSKRFNPRGILKLRKGVNKKQGKNVTPLSTVFEAAEDNDTYLDDKLNTPVSLVGSRVLESSDTTFDEEEAIETVEVEVGVNEMAPSQELVLSPKMLASRLRKLEAIEEVDSQLEYDEESFGTVGLNVEVDLSGIVSLSTAETPPKKPDVTEPMAIFGSPMGAVLIRNRKEYSSKDDVSKDSSPDKHWAMMDSVFGSCGAHNNPAGIETYINTKERGHPYRLKTSCYSINSVESSNQTEDSTVTSRSNARKVNSFSGFCLGSKIINATMNTDTSEKMEPLVDSDDFDQSMAKSKTHKEKVRSDALLHLAKDGLIKPFQSKVDKEGANLANHSSKALPALHIGSPLKKNRPFSEDEKLVNECEENHIQTPVVGKLAESLLGRNHQRSFSNRNKIPSRLEIDFNNDDNSCLTSLPSMPADTYASSTQREELTKEATTVSKTQDGCDTGAWEEIAQASFIVETAIKTLVPTGDGEAVSIPPDVEAEVAHALQTLKVFANRFGVTEGDLLMAIKSNDDDTTEVSITNPSTKPMKEKAESIVHSETSAANTLTFGEEILEAFKMYVKRK